MEAPWCKMGVEMTLKQMLRRLKKTQPAVITTEKELRELMNAAIKLVGDQKPPYVESKVNGMVIYWP